MLLLVGVFSVCVFCLFLFVPFWVLGGVLLIKIFPVVCVCVCVRVFNDILAYL